MAMEVDGKLVEGEIVEREQGARDLRQDRRSDAGPRAARVGGGQLVQAARVPDRGAAPRSASIIRYTAPLVHAAEGWEYDYALAKPATATLPIGDFTLKVDGKQIVTRRTLDRRARPRRRRSARQGPGGDAGDSATTAIYTAVRIAPDRRSWSAAPTRRPRARSRSSSTPRAARSRAARSPTELVRTDARRARSPPTSSSCSRATSACTPSRPITRSVSPRRSTARSRSSTRSSPTAPAIVGAALEAAAELRPTDVIYVGDGIPTWGEQRREASSARSPTRSTRRSTPR